MNFLLKNAVFLWLLAYQLTVPVHAELYRLVAGSSELGFRENDKQNVNIGFSSVFNELLSSESVKCDFKSFDNSDELATAISKKQVNAFFGSPLEFFRSEPYFLSSPIASGIFGTKLKSRILLLVRKDSDIRELEQLKRKKLSIQKSIAADLGGLYIETLLLEKGLPKPKHYFAEIQTADTSNKAIVDLFFKKTDVVLVSESQYEIAIELNPQLREQTTILEASEPYLTFVAALAKSTPQQEVNAIKNSLLTVNKTPKGRNILNLMKIQGFQEVSLSDLDTVRALIMKNQHLKALQNEH